jgi:hypothetical protein
MNYRPKIKKYTVFNPKPTDYVGRQCFSELKYVSGLQRVQTTFEIDESLSARKVKLYLAFLKRILIVDKFEATVDENLLVDLESKVNYRALSYLSFFRYVQEFPFIVKNLNFKNSDEEIFAEFIALHKNSKALVKYNGTGHMVLSIGVQPISLDKFKENQKVDKGCVFGYFQ